MAVGSHIRGRILSAGSNNGGLLSAFSAVVTWLLPGGIILEPKLVLMPLFLHLPVINLRFVKLLFPNTYGRLYILVTGLENVP